MKIGFSYLSLCILCLAISQWEWAQQSGSKIKSNQEVAMQISGTIAEGNVFYQLFNDHTYIPIPAKGTRFSCTIRMQKNSFFTLLGKGRYSLLADGKPIVINYNDTTIQASELNEKLFAIQKKIHSYPDAFSPARKAAIIAYCKENHDNISPAVLLIENSYAFSYEELKEVLDSTAIYYCQPNMNPKTWLDNKVGRKSGVAYRDVTMQDMDGKTVKLSDFIRKDRYLFVDFWASWCGPCKMEIPHVIDMYHLYHFKGLDVLSVSLDRDESQWKASVKKLQMPWPQVVALKGDPSTISSLYGISNIPCSILIAPDGTIIASDLRGSGLKDKLHQIFDQQ